MAPHFTSALLPTIKLLPSCLPYQSPFFLNDRFIFINERTVVKRVPQVYYLTSFDSTH